MKLLSTTFLLLFFNLLNAQLIVSTLNDTLSPFDLVQTLAGEGVVISNVNIDCPGSAFGFFENSNSILDMDEGILLTSGRAKNAEGPNDEQGRTQVNDTGGDIDLDIASAASTLDACVIEFDIVAIGNEIVFNYVFGSEEYPEFANDDFNDVFGLFISGPGITGTYSNAAENLAIIPNTGGTPVSINTVNDINNPQCYIENGIGNTPNLNPDLQYDGITKTLTATATVEPCATYRLKFAVADVKDRLFDSGVFIEAGSLKSQNIEISLSTGYTNADGLEVMVEGCIDGEITVTLDEPVTETTALYFNSEGTANQIDFINIPESITFLEGDSTFTFSIEALADNINEGLEYLTFSFTASSGCTELPAKSLDIFVQDRIDAIIADVIPVPVCEDVQLMASGGDTYTWFPSDFLDNPNIPNPICSATENMVYGCEVRLGTCVDTAFINVDFLQAILPTTENALELCPNEPYQLNVENVISVNWTSPTSVNDLSCTNCPNPVFNASNAGFAITYHLEIEDNFGCTVLDTLNIVVGDFTVFNPTYNFTKCIDENLEILVEGGDEGTYNWTPSFGLSCDDCPNPTLSINNDTIYQVTALRNNCVGTTQVQINVVGEMANAGEDIVVCDAINQKIGPNPKTNHTYMWVPDTGLSNPNIAQPNINLSLQNNATEIFSYRLTITDDKNCTSSDEIIITIVPSPIISTIDDVKIIEGNSIELIANGLTAGGSYIWFNSVMDSIGENGVNVTPLVSTTYFVNGKNFEGCEAMDTLNVEVVKEPQILFPTAFSPNNDGVNDIFRPISIEIIEIYEFSVFDRWGKEVFSSSKSGNLEWDGTYQSTPLPLGVYTYQIKFLKFGQDSPTIQSNFVTLIR